MSGWPVLTKVTQTCFACPSQWDAWDGLGTYYYLRYRWGQGTVSVNDKVIRSFTYGDSFGGVIDLETFAQLADLDVSIAGGTLP